MPKLTDYVRQGYRRRLGRDTELPEWWNIAIWVGFLGVIVMLVVGAVLARGDSPGATDAQGEAPGFKVQTLDPRSLGSSPSPGGATPSASASGSQPLPAGVSAKDFTASAAAKVSLTGGGTTVVPAGALNVATAAAKAAATGNWSGIPFIGTGRPVPARKPTPQGSVVGALTVADPAMTGNSQYVFRATVTRGAKAKPESVELLVERDQSRYAIRAR